MTRPIQLRAQFKAGAETILLSSVLRTDDLLMQLSQRAWVQP